MENDFILERVKTLREWVRNLDEMSVETRNKIVDELDMLQETIVYRDFPVV